MARGWAGARHAGFPAHGIPFTMTGPISGHARTRHPAQGVGSYPMILRRPLPEGRRSHVYFRSSKCDVVLQAAIRGGQDGKFKDAMRAAGTDKIKRRRKRCPLNPMS